MPLEMRDSAKKLLMTEQLFIFAPCEIGPTAANNRKRHCPVFNTGRPDFGAQLLPAKGRILTRHKKYIQQAAVSWYTIIQALTAATSFCPCAVKRTPK